MSCLRLDSRCVGADGAAEVLGRDDRGGVDRPEVGELDAALLEDRLAGLPVLLDDVAPLPGHLVVGVHARRWCRSARSSRPCASARAPARAPSWSRSSPVPRLRLLVRRSSCWLTRCDVCVLLAVLTGPDATHALVATGASASRHACRWSAAAGRVARAASGSTPVASRSARSSAISASKSSSESNAW